MLSRKTLTVWTGIILLSSMFLMGQEPGWAPSDVIYCTDLDGDGYGQVPALLCPFVLFLDCNDLDPAVNPRATEICNGIDDNCDDLIDVIDDDGDGYFSGIPPCAGNDCNDSDPTVHPGALEVCNGLDDDCDSVVPVDETDVDGDGYVECTVWAGSIPGILGGGDCDETNAARNPGEIEAPHGAPICLDGVDNDCDTLIDINDNQCQQCTQPSDCDDSNPCTDDDCVGFGCTNTDNTLPCDDANACTTNDTCSGGACIGGPAPDGDTDGYVTDACPGGDDCLDSDPNVNPGATEGPPGDANCSDGLDNDCDGLTDDAEDLDCVAPTCSVPADCDDGNPCTNDDCINSHCSYSSNTAPCDDADPCTMNDTCFDGSCVGGPPTDGDSDGYVIDSCPGGNDCVDSNPNVNPGATEGPLGDPTCSDTLDNDCDGLTDAAQDPGCA